MLPRNHHGHLSRTQVMASRTFRRRCRKLNRHVAPPICIFGSKEVSVDYGLPANKGAEPKPRAAPHRLHLNFAVFAKALLCFFYCLQSDFNLNVPIIIYCPEAESGPPDTHETPAPDVLSVECGNSDLISSRHAGGRISAPDSAEQWALTGDCRPFFPELT